MATNGGSVREAAAARRRRIAERGSDRLALITGRVQSLPSASSTPLSPPVVESHLSSTEPSSPPVSRSSDQLPTSDKNTDPPLNTETTSNIIETKIQQPIIPKSETKPETISQLSSTPETKSTEQNPQKPEKPQTFTPETKITEQNPQTIKPIQLRTAITSSENTRKIISIITALFVLVSYSDFPIVSNNFIKNTLLSRPLVLVLLTNITIVFAPFLLEKVNRKQTRRSFSIGELGFGDSLGMALEFGLLMKSGLSSLFMDCSVYSVIVVCGVSILEKFRW